MHYQILNSSFFLKISKLCFLNFRIALIKNENWEELFDFCYNSCIEILRELYKEVEIDDAFMSADIPLFLEHGLVKSILSYPEYYEIMSLTKISEKRNLPPKYIYKHEYFRLEKTADKKYDYYHDHDVL